MKRRVIIHPVLFAILPILSLYAHNMGELSLGELLMSAAVAALASLALWLVLGLILRDKVRSALAVSLFWLWFFSYGHILALLEKAPALAWLFPEQYSFTIIYSVLLCAGVAVLILRGRSWDTLSSIVNLVALVLVGWQVLTVGTYEVKRQLAYRKIPEAEPISGIDPGRVGTRPNIYLIILDGYARADVLERVYDYDNSEFVDYLVKKGFFVAPNGRANYCQTLLSLASCLNLDYLDELGKRLGPDVLDQGPLREMIADNKVCRFLQERGYRTVSLSSGFSPTEMTTADIHLSPFRGLTEFQRTILNTTPLPSAFVHRFVHRLGVDAAEIHRRRVLYTFQHLPDTARLRPPVFVFAHIVSPHPPFLFDRNGPLEFTGALHFGDARWFRGRRKEYVSKYREQLMFINRQTEAALDQLLARARHPTVIILQADHGPGSGLIWEDLKRTDVRERFGTLNAYYLPDDGDTPWSDDVSPVNVFRVVLNRYFATDLPLLPNESYFSPWDHTYRFTRVTDAVNASDRER